MTLRVREMKTQDTRAVAQLHVESWRSVYRGILADEYLDGVLLEDHFSLWTQRLSSPTTNHIGLIADAGEGIVGFLFAMPEHDRRWGTYLDNFHVSPNVRGRGIGSRLLLELSEVLSSKERDAGLHLWAYESNVQACRYYESVGGRAMQRAVNEAPGGGEVPEWLYWWKTLEQLRDALPSK